MANISYEVRWKEFCCNPECQTDHLVIITVSRLDSAIEILKSIIDPGTEVTIQENFE